MELIQAQEELKAIQQRLEVITQDNSSETKHERVLEYRELRFQEEWLSMLISRLENQAMMTRRKSAIGERFATRTFDTFISNPDNEKAYQDCLYYAEHFQELKRNDKNSLILVGGYGVGKTHLAAAICNHLIDNDKVGVLFNTWAGHLSEVKKTFDADPLKKAELLIIDDFGKEKPTEWNQEVLFEIVNSRYENNLPIVMTTNLKGQQADEHMGKAVQSRLIEMCSFVRVNGEDRRIWQSK